MGLVTECPLESKTHHSATQEDEIVPDEQRPAKARTSDTTPGDDKPASSGLIPGTKITEAYARLVARDAYFWAWPMVNVYNRRLAFQQIPEPGRLGGVLPVAPLNRLSMLTDYIKPEERAVACPNQDVVYGGALIALDLSPVVIQVPRSEERRVGKEWRDGCRRCQENK